jgi:BirA family biotin operon repressor/biotin-[acetyl-CoA-carboxylase] ligase
VKAQPAVACIEAWYYNAPVRRPAIPVTLVANPAKEVPAVSDLSAPAIGAALTTRRLGRAVLYYGSVGSTNDLAREAAAAGAAEGLLVIADEQTAGRGRAAGRRWWAPPGSSLLMSLLLRPPLPPAEAQQATMCLGLGAVEGIAAATGVQARLKWPNDVVYGDRKLAGMLTEIELEGERVKWLVLGIGINVNVPGGGDAATGSRPDSTEPATVAPLPEDVAGQAIWLSQALGHPASRLQLLVAIMAATEARYERLLAGESPHEAWAAHLDTLGRTVTIAQPGGEVQGIATGVSPQGALLVQTVSGDMRTVWAGDVTSLR